MRDYQKQARRLIIFRVNTSEERSGYMVTPHGIAVFSQYTGGVMHSLGIAFVHNGQLYERVIGGPLSPNQISRRVWAFVREIVEQ